MNKFAVFDIDGTVYRDGMYFIVAEAIISQYDFTVEAKLLAAAKHTFKSRGSTEAYWTYNKTILELFEAVLPNITPDQLAEVIDQLLSDKHDYCYAYTTQLIDRFKSEGRSLVAVSGSIANIVEPFALSLGFDYIVASGLEILDGSFTGKRVAQTKQGKDQIVKELVAKHGLTFTDSVGVGDTHRDISMLAIVEQAIAFNPNAALHAEAKKNGWKIVLERKNMVYELAAKDDTYIVEAAHPIFDDNHLEHLR